MTTWAGSAFAARVRSMREAFVAVRPSSQERVTPRAGDQLVPRADVVMDRAFTIDAAPDVVWPWLVQLGKHRAGWYLLHAVEVAVPPSRRALRRIDARWLRLAVNDVIPDYGGRNEIFRVAELVAPDRLVYRSRRGRTDVSWSITCHAMTAAAGSEQTRVCLRLQMAPVRRKRLVKTIGELFDLLTVADLAAGLRERLAEQATLG
jgi:hypothetical protein